MCAMWQMAAAGLDAAYDGVLYVGDRSEDERAALDADVSFEWATDFFGA